MRLTKWLAFPAITLVMVAVGYGQDIHYNYDRGANFQSYKTYQWVESQSAPLKIELPSSPPDILGGATDIRGGVVDDPLLDQSVKRAIDEQLAQKGLTRVEKNADLQVAYHAVLREERGIDLSGSGWRGGGPGWWGGSVQGQTSTIPIGTLVVDLFDPTRKQLVWRGDASKTLDIKKDPDKNYRTLQKAMAKLFKNYPPSPKK